MKKPFPPSPAVLGALSGGESERLHLYPAPEAVGLARVITDRLGVSERRGLTGKWSDELPAFCHHALVLMAHCGMTPDDVRSELASRHGVDRKVKQEPLR